MFAWNDNKTHFSNQKAAYQRASRVKWCAAMEVEGSIHLALFFLLCLRTMRIRLMSRNSVRRELKGIITFEISMVKLRTVSFFWFCRWACFHSTTSIAACLRSHLNHLQVLAFAFQATKVGNSDVTRKLWRPWKDLEASCKTKAGPACPEHVHTMSRACAERVQVC